MTKLIKSPYRDLHCWSDSKGNGPADVVRIPRRRCPDHEVLARSIAERKVRVEAGQIIIVKERMSKATVATSARRQLLERPSATRMILCSRAVEFSDTHPDAMGKRLDRFSLLDSLSLRMPFAGNKYKTTTMKRTKTHTKKKTIIPISYPHIYAYYK